MLDRTRLGATPFLDGGGEMGAAMRQFDWADSALGPPHQWPEALRISLKILLNTNHPMLIWWGPGLTQFYNDGFGEIAGSYLRPGALGKSGRIYWEGIWDIIGPDVEHVMTGKGGIWREHQLMPTDQADKSLHHYWTYSFSPIDTGSSVGGVLVVCRDETQEYRGTLALRAREAELARVQQIGKIGGLEVNLTAGFRNRRSPEYLQIHGLPPGSVNETHEDWVRRIHPDDRSRTEGMFIDAVNGHTTGYSIQYRIIRPSDGETRWILAKTEIERDEAGKAVRLVGAHADVTDQVIAEQALRQSEEKYRTLALELTQSLDKLRTAQDRLIHAEKLAALGQLTAGIAHETKNPLNFVNNFARLSLDRIAELVQALNNLRPDDKMTLEVDRIVCTLQRNLEKIFHHGARADRIISNMLLQSRAGSNEHRLVDLNSILDDTVNLAFHGARAEKPGFNIKIERDFDPDAGRIDLYPQEISRVFLNLLSNGFYAAINSKKNQTAPTLWVKTVNLGDSVEIRIRDNGDGIKRDLRERIFDPFFTTKPAGEGTGLGLSICYDVVVKQHGGRIDVETVPDYYTEFVVDLPRRIAELSSGRA